MPSAFSVLYLFALSKGRTYLGTIMIPLPWQAPVRVLLEGSHYLIYATTRL